MDPISIYGIVLFNFVPSYLWVNSNFAYGMWRYSENNDIGLHWMNGVSKIYSHTSNGNHNFISLNNKTISWYLNNNKVNTDYRARF